jgi:hypothetical protein
MMTPCAGLFLFMLRRHRDCAGTMPHLQCECCRCHFPTEHMLIDKSADAAANLINNMMDGIAMVTPAYDLGR